MAKNKEKQRGYVKASIDGEEYYLGIFEDVESELQRIEDAGEIGTIFNPNRVNLEKYPREVPDPSLHIISEEEFLNIAGKKAPYEF